MIASILFTPMGSQIADKIEERQTFDLIVDPISDFYTAHPYPPPVENLDRARDEWRDQNRQRAEFHLFWPGQPERADLDILIAGCGTWQAAKYALCHPSANVTGIDVSQTSLRETEILINKYDLKNLKIQQLPLEHVETLGRGFDLIVCTGVLHHLADPDAGLRALRQALTPAGAIYLMVYAPYGRAGIYMLQDYCRRVGVGHSFKEIADLASVVKALAPQHPLATLLRRSRDGQNPDALADALLNPRDQSYSVSQLLALIERNQLRFGRWYWQAPYLPQCGAISATPHAARLAALPNEEQYAAMELWRGMMTSHSAILYRADAIDSHTDISFDGDQWRAFVPVRLPSTLCIEERLPAGAAGVLLNRSHPFHDLILLIDRHEKQMFERIDGRLTIAEIAGNRDMAARKFFEKLWQYDQVVFDVSRWRQNRTG